MNEILPEHNFKRKGERCPGFGEAAQWTTNLEPRLLDTLLKIAEHDLADTVSVCWDTYWKTPQYVIRADDTST